MDTILEEVERLQDALDGLTMKAEERTRLENRYERGVMQELIKDILDNKVMQHDAAIEAIEYLQAEVERLQKCERHEYERANKAEARVAHIEASAGLKCPNADCNDSGGYPAYGNKIDRHGYPEVYLEQCEFCWTVPDSIFNRKREALQEADNG